MRAMIFATTAHQANDAGRPSNAYRRTTPRSAGPAHVP